MHGKLQTLLEKYKTVYGTKIFALERYGETHIAHGFCHSIRAFGHFIQSVNSHLSRFAQNDEHLDWTSDAERLHPDSLPKDLTLKGDIFSNGAKIISKKTNKHPSAYFEKIYFIGPAPWARRQLLLKRPSPLKTSSQYAFRTQGLRA